MMTRVTRRSAKRTRITTGVAVIVKSIIDVHHLIRQREPDADRTTPALGRIRPNSERRECCQL
jgi:hypothetical protein